MKPHIHIGGVEMNVIDAITDRAHIWFQDRSRRDIKMDIIAAHLACPLRLNDLLDADDWDFVHDIVGIEVHLNRETFKLDNCFLPRFADIKVRRR